MLFYCFQQKRKIFIYPFILVTFLNLIYYYKLQLLRRHGIQEHLGVNFVCNTVTNTTQECLTLLWQWLSSWTNSFPTLSSTINLPQFNGRDKNGIQQSSNSFFTAKNSNFLLNMIYFNSGHDYVMPRNFLKVIARTNLY